MPGKVRVKIIAGRNLPVMDRSNDSADAYVEIKLANVTYKTDVYRKSLNPQWNTDFYRFELDDAELQDEPLQIRLMDHDTYTANDAIGKVSISLNPLLLPTTLSSSSSLLIGSGCCGVGGPATIVSEKGAVMAGWIPVFDTMHGIRGEVNVVVKVDLFSDVNKFRQSSCGVQFFHSPNIPYGYHAQIVHGFVEELVVNDDPEYQWIDKIRTPRASNDARQLVFLRLSGQVQRKIGLKAIDLGANAVIGYTQCFDLEGDVGVVARGIGTAVTLERNPNMMLPPVAATDEQLKNLKFFQQFDRLHPSWADDLFTDNPVSLNESQSAGAFIEPATTAAGVVDATRTLFDGSCSTLCYLGGDASGSGGNNTTAAGGAASLAGAGDADSSVESIAHLKQLLDQEDGRGQKSTSRLRHRIHHIGKQSRNVLARMSRRKSREDLQIARSLSESLTELSLYASSSMGRLSSRSSGGGSRKGRRGSSSSRRSSAEGSGMAALLVSSMLAAPSLNCIKEDAIQTDAAHEEAYAGRACPVVGARPATVPTLASVPSTSNRSVLSSVTSLTSMSSISELDDNDDAGDEGSESGSAANASAQLDAAANDGGTVTNETVSMVVESVLALERAAQEKLQHEQTEKYASEKRSAASAFAIRMPSSSSLVHHLPASSVAPPSTSRHFPTALLPSYLQPLSNEESDIWIQPGSTVDEPEINDSRRESMFHDLKENIFETMHTLQDTINAVGGIATTGGAPAHHDDHLFQMAIAQMMREQAVLLGAPVECVAASLKAGSSIAKITASPVQTIIGADDATAAASSSCPSSSASSGSTTAAVVGRSTPPPRIVQHARSSSVRLKALRKRIASFCTRATSPALVSLRTIASSLPLRRLRTQSESTRLQPLTAATTTAATGGKAMSLSPTATRILRGVRAIEPATAADSYGSTIDLTGMKLTRIKPFISLSDLTTSAHAQTPTPRDDVQQRCAVDLVGGAMGNHSPFPSSDPISSSSAIIIDTNTAVLLAPPSHPSPVANTQPTTTIAFSTQSPTTPIIAPETSAMPSSSSSSSSSSISSRHSPSSPTSAPSDRTVAVAAASASAAAAAASAASAGKPTANTTGKDIGHVRAESTAVAPTTGSTTIAEREAAAAAALSCRRSSDSDLAVTPKATHESAQLPQTQAHQAHQQHQHNQHNQHHQHTRHHHNQHHHHHPHHHHQHHHQIMQLPPPIYNARAAGASSKLKLRQLHPDSLDMLEYPFLTLTKYPIGFILNIGATVCARSVKLLERVPNPDEPETRDSWWKELRMEIRSHARTLGCNVILGYSETTSISDEVCVLSATGTAAIINVSPSSSSAGELGLHNSAAPTKKTSVQHNSSATNNNNNNNDDHNTTGGSLDSNTAPTGGGGAATASASSAAAAATTVSPPKDGGGTTAGGVPSSHNGAANNHNAAAGTSAEAAAARPAAVQAHNAACANCSLCHIPYNRASAPFHAHMKRCQLCRNANVPDVLLATIELPDALPLTGRGCFLQAQVCRTKKDLKSESNAKEISDCLPFLEYDLHRLLINKLKMKGMNAIFGLKSTVTIGEKVIALIATGTAVFVPALAPPTLPKIVAGNSWTNTEKLQEFQRALQETVDRNREAYHLKSLSELEAGVDSGPDDSCDEEASRSPDGGGGGGAQQKFSSGSGGGGGGAGGLTISGSNAGAGGVGNKGTFVLEVDDIEDLEIIALLMESCPPDGFHVVNTETVPGVPLHQPPLQVVRNLQMFTQIWRAKLGASAPGGHHNHNQGSNFARHFQRLLQTIFFKLRTMLPCAICNLQFSLALPDTDEIQLLVTGMAIGLCDTSKLMKKLSIQDRDEELIFSLEDEHQHQSGYNQSQYSSIEQQQQQQRSIRSPGHHLVQTGSLKVNPSAHNEQHRKFAAASRVGRERYGVELTPLSYVPGGIVQKYLGNLNFFFIRESTSIRESGGVSGFVHSFITEMLAVVRAHVTALGGNALVSFYMTELELVDNPHKNQGQCLISVGGDVVLVSYYADE